VEKYLILTALPGTARLRLELSAGLPSRNLTSRSLFLFLSLFYYYYYFILFYSIFFIQFIFLKGESLFRMQLHCHGHKSLSPTFGNSPTHSSGLKHRE
jgi:hypothetical protein